MQRQEEHRYITPVNITCAVINAAVFAVLEILGDTSDAAFMLAHGAMYPPAVLYGGEWYRLLTSAFLHFGISHLLNNMVLLVCLGSYLERAYGKVRFLIFYLVCAVGSSLVSMGHMLYTGDIAVSGGASGVIFGMIGALLFLVLKNKGRFEALSAAVPADDGAFLILWVFHNRRRQCGACGRIAGGIFAGGALPGTGKEVRCICFPCYFIGKQI